MSDVPSSPMPISYLDKNLYVCDHGVGLEVVHRSTGEGAFVPNEMGGNEIREEIVDLKVDLNADVNADPALMAEFINARMGGLFAKVSTQ